MFYIYCYIIPDLVTMKLPLKCSIIVQDAIRQSLTKAMENRTVKVRQVIVVISFYCIFSSIFA